jgi:LEA14-like dessication related protein
LDLDLVYFNPNRIGLMLDQVELDVFLNGKSLGNTHQRTQIHIPGKQEFTLPVSINLDMKNLLGNAVSSMMNEKVKLRTVGKVRVGKAGIYQWIPLDITNEMSMSPFR